MAPITKKTYSRKNNDTLDSCMKEKENVDPFDELFSSPLKQEVQFKPLSYWGKKIKNLESKKKSKTTSCRLYEISDSDDNSSPVGRKRKPKSRSDVSSAMKLQLRNTNSSLLDSTNNSVVIGSFVNLRKPYKFFVSSNRISNDGFSRVNKQKWDSRHDTSQEHVYNLLQSVRPKRSRCEKTRECTVESNTSFDSSKLESEEFEESGRVSEYLGNTSTEMVGLNVTDYTLMDSKFDSTKFQEEEGWINDSELEEFWEMENGTTLLDKTEISNKSLSDDTIGDFSTDESTSILDSGQEVVNDSPTSGSDGTQIDSPTSNMSLLTTKISDMTITNETVTHASSSDTECDRVLEDKEVDSSRISSEAFRNITIRRRYDRDYLKENVTSEKGGEQIGTPSENESNGEEKEEEEESEKEEEQPSVILKDSTNLDWSRVSCLPNPVFESTRMFDDVRENMSISKSGKRESVFDGTSEGLDATVVLKPGKKWLRSMLVLKQIRNGDISTNNLESTRVKGRKFESFVQEILGMQNDLSFFSTTSADATILSKATTKSSLHEGSHAFNSTLDFRVSRNEDVQENSVVCNASRREIERPLMNLTVKINEFDNSPEKPSAFRSALGLQVNESIVEETIIGKDKCTNISPREFVLSQCGQKDILPFDKYFNERTLKDCKKIGEGVYGEVFMYNSDTVIKIIPIEGEDLVNGERQKNFEEIISEIVIASKLTNLRNGERHRTSGFSRMKKCWCVKGKYPKHLIQVWNEYDQYGNGSENDSPVMFTSNQLYIILELENGGKNLESFVFTTSGQSLSIYLQTAFSLAAAEKAFHFEHRDLHWGNVLISPTKDKFMHVVLNDVEYKIPTKGVKVSIIDFTLSRMSHEGCYIFNDLAVDPELFLSEGDYQFDIYRMMQTEVKNDWSLYRPKTNIFWLHYLIDKMLKLVRYKNKSTQGHKKYLRELQFLESIVLEYRSTADFAMSDAVEDLLNKF